MDLSEDHSSYLVKYLMEEKVNHFLNDDPYLESVSNSQNDTLLLTIDQNAKLDEITVSLHPVITTFSEIQEKSLDSLNKDSIIISVEDKENILLISSQDYRDTLFPIYSDFIIDIDSNLMANEETSLDSIKEKQYQSKPICCRKHEKYFKKFLKKKMNKKVKKRNFSSINITRLFSSLGNEKYLKPKFSHNILCAFAIWSNVEQKLEVSHIYKFLCECFPYFKTAKFHWKNSLRHSLATCNWFQKSETHRTAKKGYKWILNKNRINCLECEIKKQCIKDISKLYHCVANKEVCSLLFKMGLIDFDVNLFISST